MTKKDHILRSAQVLFGREGYHGATVKQIAEMAGVGFGLVSHYFGSKEELFLQAGFGIIDDLLGQLRAAADAAPNGLKAVREVVRTYLNYTQEHRNTFPMLIRCSPFSDVENLAGRAEIAAKFKEFFDEIQRCVERGIADGSIEDVAPEQTASIIYFNIMGTVRTRFLTPYDMPDLIEETLEFVTRAVAKDA